MGIESLNEYLQQNGKEKLIELLLSSKVVITEKINAHRVSILKDRLNNIEFYSKKKSTPICTIDRIISNLYEPFISHIIKEKENLPQGTFNFYFVHDDLDVSYTKKPKNNLLLTDMSFSKKTLKKDTRTVQEIAEKINTGYQKIVFSGKLMKRKHIKHIVDFLEKDGILPEIMTNVFGENATSLSENKTDIIEGYIFKFENGLYKLEDNRFKRKTYPKTNTSAYEMLIMELHDFMSHLDFTSIKVDVKNTDLRYANFIYEAFNIYLEENRKVIDTKLIKPPLFMKSTGSLGMRYITNELTKKNLKDERYEYLLRVFLTIFQKPILKRGLLSDEFVRSHNKLIKHIQNYTTNTENIFDFRQFKNFRNN